jgi:hypothetical protein
LATDDVMFFTPRSGLCEPRMSVLAVCIIVSVSFKTRVTVVNYCAGDEIGNNEMGGACSMYVGGERCVLGFGGKT